MPRWPYISTQFSTMFATRPTTAVYITGRVQPMPSLPKRSA
jgi:hypothetical protein